MKNSCILLSALLVAFTHPQTKAQDSSPFDFAVSEWSFGDIREENGAVSHTFEFVNRGATPAAIDRVVTSCGCTTPEYPRTPIAPGGKGSIVVTFDPTGMPGDFSKSVGVMSGGGKHRDLLIIEGRVIPRPKTIEEQFPVDLGGGVRVDNTLLAFRLIPQGGSSAMAVAYINTSDRAVSLTLQPEPDRQSGLLDVFAPETICAGCRGNITLTYDLSGKIAYGQIHDVVRPVIDGTPSTKTIYTTMTGIDDFAGVDTSLAPKFTLNGSFHDFGEVRGRTVPYVYRLTATNDGPSPLHIRSVQEKPGTRITLRAGMTIAPGASLPFEIVFYSSRYEPGTVRESIGLVVDDPTRPTREIRISAIIK